MPGGFSSSSNQRAHVRSGVCVGALLTATMSLAAADPIGDARPGLLVAGIDGGGPVIGDAVTAHRMLRAGRDDDARPAAMRTSRRCPTASARDGPLRVDRVK